MARTLLFLAGSVCALMLGAAALWITQAGAPEPGRGAARLSDVELPREAELIEGALRPGQTVGSVLKAAGIAVAEQQAMLAAMLPVFPARQFRLGNAFSIDRLFSGTLRGFHYHVDVDRMLHVERNPAGAYAAHIETLPRQTSVDVVAGGISAKTPSLTQALDAEGEGIDLALQMADIFSGELDFSSELQPGDSFRLLVERRTREGAPAAYGAVLAAEFVASGRAIRAVRFTTAEGKPAYYDEQGRSLRRFFLKSPLKFEPRITSRFSSGRRHPILNYTRAHNGVDYAAPTGAPVAAVAPGTVSFAGWTNGGGRTVRVRHPNGYESEYLHLSAISVRAGERVSQGDVVGKVGATGLATGPHLHYGLRRDGRYVNPVVEHRNMPPGEPIAPHEMDGFRRVHADVFGRLAGTARAAN